MCWSGEASAALATVGFAGTFYAAYKKEPTVLWMALGYFSLMELLQAFTYSVIDQCGNPSNQVATLLGYLHITFQPFFIIATSLYFIDQHVARKVAPLCYTLCFINAIMMIIRVYPFSWAGHCAMGDILCGEMLCSVRGTWHIAWLVPLNQIYENFPWYFLIGFGLPILFGSWRFTLYHILTGPLLARATTDNMNEWPAVWCLLSIGLLLIVVKTPIRKILHVRSWWLWRFIAVKN
ncbi:MAG: DUF5765 domain-containing protein [Rickettsiales bacterium]|nr:DUF5765 domain-containing protein [Rickettsiales bacterium]